MMTTQRMLAPVALGLILGVPGPAEAQYAFTPITVPGAAAPAGTSVIGINDRGEVVGTYVDAADGNRYGFVLSKGAFTRLDAPGADGFTVAQGINNAGQIAGQYTDADGNGHG